MRAPLAWCAGLAAAALLLLLPPGVARAASLSVSPSTAASGAALTVTGSGWDPNGFVDVYWSASEQNGTNSTSPDVRIATVQADSAGNVSASVTAAVPNDAMVALSSSLTPGAFCPTSLTGETIQGYSETTSATSVVQSVYFTPWLVAAYPNVGGASQQFDNASATYLFSTTGQVAVAGCFFTPGRSFTLSFPGQSAVTGTVASDGSAEATVDIASIPSYTSGTATLTDGTLSASFPVVVYSPTIQVSTSSVAAGGSLTVSGTGLAPGAALTVTGNNGAVLLSGAPTGISTQADGSFSFVWNVPSNQASGTYSIDVSVPSGAVASTQVTVSGTSGGGCPSGPYHLLFTQGPPSALTSGSSFGASVSVVDSGGAVDTCSTDNIAVSLQAPGGASASLGGTTQVAAVGGVAGFSLSISGSAASGYVLAAADATDSSVASATTTSFSIQQDRLAFTQQPPADAAWGGSTFTVTVGVETPSGALDTANLGTINLAPVSPAGLQASLAGDTSEPVINGTATFVVTLSGGNGPGYGLQATDATDASITSATSGGIAFPQASITFDVQPGAAVIRGGSVSATVTAVVYDQNGSVMSGQGMVLSLLAPGGGAEPILCLGASSSQTSCSFAAGSGATSLSAGVHDDSVSTGGGYVLQVAAANGYAVQSQPFAVLAASPLVMSAANPWPSGDTYGAWGVQQPTYQSPGSDAAFVLPYRFAGVRLSLPYTAGTHAYLAGDAPDAQLCVDGSWQLDITGGTGSSVATSVYGSGCEAPVDLATLNLPTGTYGAQLVLTAPASGTQYGTGDVVLYSMVPDGYETCDCWPITDLPNTFTGIQLALGSPSAVVGTQAQIPLDVASAPYQVAGVHAEASWDPTAIDVAVDAVPGGSIYYGNRVPGHWGFIAGPPWSASNSGYPVLELDVTCLQPGSWPITMSGSWWGEGDAAQQLSFSGTVSCSAAAAAQGGSASSGASLDPTDGSLSVAVTGSGLATATQAVLVSGSGAVVATATSVVPDAQGTSLTAGFGSVAGGVYTLRIEDGSGQVLATVAGTDVPPALPYFTVTEGDALPQVPGFHETHFWRVTNVGEVNGVAVLLFVFPDFVTPEPTLDMAALPAGSQLLEHDQSLSAAAGSWAEIVSVPVDAGQSVDVPWTMTLDPSAVFGTSAQLSTGDSLPVVVMRLGMPTTAQAQSLGLLSGPASGFGQTLAEDGNENLIQGLGGVAALQGADASAYRAYLESSAPSLAAQVYGAGLLSAVQTLQDSIAAGIASLPPGGTTP